MLVRVRSTSLATRSLRLAGVTATVIATVLLVAPSIPARVAPGVSPSVAGTPEWRHLVALAAVNPGRIGNGGLVYDAKDHYLVYFGGQLSGPGYSTVQNQTWIFDGTWHNLTGTTGATPSARTVQFSLAYDAADGYVVLFSGEDNGGLSVGGTWTFSGGTWTPLTPTVSPPNRIFGSMAYDPGARAVVLFGGSTTDAFGSGFYNDTWLFAGGNWSKLPLTHAPSLRRAAQMAFDPAANATILFGGVSQGGSGLSDTWYFRNGSWGRSPVTGPPGRWMGAMGFVPAVGGLTLFGGCTSVSCVTSLGDTWVLLRGAWYDATALYGLTHAPSARGPLTSAYDPDTRQFIVYGGHLNGTYPYNHAGYYLSQTWEFV